MKPYWCNSCKQTLVLKDAIICPNCGSDLIELYGNNRQRVGANANSGDKHRRILSNSTITPRKL